MPQIQSLKLYELCPEVTFEELLDLARAEDAAKKSQAAATGDNTHGASAGNSSSGGGADSSAALSDALPPGSDSRRAAVAALGNEIHTRLLRSNCVPASAVLAAALLPTSVVGECEEHSDAVRIPPLYYLTALCWECCPASVRRCRSIKLSGRSVPHNGHCKESVVCIQTQSWVFGNALLLCSGWLNCCKKHTDCMFTRDVCVQDSSGSFPHEPRARAHQAPTVSSAALTRRYRWVQRQLAAHGVPVMPLPMAPLAIPCCAQSPDFLHGISAACSPHITITKQKAVALPPKLRAPIASATEGDSSRSTRQRRTPSPRRSSRSGAAASMAPQPCATVPFSVQLLPGAEPTLWQHTRLNMALPATAPVGLVAAGLCAGNGGVLPCGAELNGLGTGAVDSACLVSNVLWLRGLLAPDLNAVLGMEALTSPQSVRFASPLR